MYRVMALNFSQRPIFPAHTSEDNLVSPLRIVNGYVMEGMPEKGEGFVRPRHVNNRELQDCFDYGRDRVDRGGVAESVSKDIIDLLPPDPFGMDIDISTTFTAITGWLEDLEVDYKGYGRDNIGSSKEDYRLFAGFNLIWNSAMRFQSFPGNVLFDDKSAAAFRVNQFADGRDSRYGLCQDAVGSGCKAEDMVCSNSGSTSTLATNFDESLGNSGFCSDDDGGAPHEAFVLALSHLGPRDLISVQRVCRSLRSVVRDDSLLWRNIHIDQPLNERITDDVLVELTSRAQGYLQCLSLVECPRITDDGLRRVLRRNPKLTKLCVPGCTRLSIEGIMNMLKAFNSTNGTPGIKYLRIGGLYGVTLEHFEDLKFLLGIDNHVQRKGYKPHYYLRGNFYLLCDDERAIDIEICPRCEKLRLVYDCPAVGCQVQDQSAHVCRACTLCIARCVECGRCINDTEYEETFCLELRCSDCIKQWPKFQEKLERKGGLSQNDDLHQQSSNLCLHG